MKSWAAATVTVQSVELRSTLDHREAGCSIITSARNPAQPAPAQTIPVKEGFRPGVHGSGTLDLVDVEIRVSRPQIGAGENVADDQRHPEVAAKLRKPGS